jgi:peptidoglycan biosynthesis protein MviN/MurJ (putative lipid II flippase)
MLLFVVPNLLLTQYFMARGMEFVCMRIVIMAAFINILLNIFLIHRMMKQTKSVMKSGNVKENHRVVEIQVE